MIMGTNEDQVKVLDVIKTSYIPWSHMLRMPQ